MWILKIYTPYGWVDWFKLDSRKRCREKIEWAMFCFDTFSYSITKERA